jgi:hypothetical protein
VKEEQSIGARLCGFRCTRIELRTPPMVTLYDLMAGLSPDRRGSVSAAAVRDEDTHFGRRLRKSAEQPFEMISVVQGCDYNSQRARWFIPRAAHPLPLCKILRHVNVWARLEHSRADPDSSQAFQRLVEHGFTTPSTALEETGKPLSQISPYRKHAVAAVSCWDESGSTPGSSVHRCPHVGRIDSWAVRSDYGCDIGAVGALGKCALYPGAEIAAALPFRGDAKPTPSVSRSPAGYPCCDSAAVSCSDDSGLAHNMFGHLPLEFRGTLGAERRDQAGLRRTRLRKPRHHVDMPSESSHRDDDTVAGDRAGSGRCSLPALAVAPARSSRVCHGGRKKWKRLGGDETWARLSERPRSGES